MALTLGVHWFRQDLRLKNNPSLKFLSKKVDEIIPIYIFDPKERIGSVSKWWLEQSLYSLDETISELDGRLNIFIGKPEHIILSILSNNKIKYISWNRLYDPYIIKRDKKIKSSITLSEVVCKTHNGFLLNEPWDIKNNSGSFFKVFTPYWRNCNEIIKQKSFEKNLQIRKFANLKLKNIKKIKDLELINKNMKWIEKIKNNWMPGENNAQKKLNEYINYKANKYNSGRDRPDQNLTSKLSPYLHFGEISPIQIYHQVSSSKKN